LNNGISEKELKQFAFDVYYKAILLKKIDSSIDTNAVIDIDNDKVDEIIKTTLHSKCTEGTK